jgi:hypothetical protein
MTIVEPWQPVAPWASLSTNLTALTDQCLSVTSSGVVFLKQVAFDLALMNSIPANVKVACSYQDQYCEYINSADSSGSPMTVEVGAGLNVGYYTAKDSENRICFTSTNKTLVLANVASNSNPLDIIKINSGIIGSGIAECIIGTANENLASGQLVYYSTATDKYALASASANSTIGYGNVWLNILTANTDTDILLLQDGCFNLATWSWTAGNTIWASTTNGALTATYPSATGNQLVSVGQARNATEILFEFPNGFYMEHI